MPSIGIGNWIGKNNGVRSWDNKMWASYTQLNPGVYSDAIATEFKRRMKPDYVERILVPNGGYANTTDWVDSNADGLADGWIASAITPSIVTGNGFSGNAQRIVSTAVVGHLSFIINAPVSTSITLSFKYRSATAFSVANVMDVPLVVPANVGSAIAYSTTFTTSAVMSTMRFYAGMNSGGNIGDWLEIDEITLTATAASNYFTTFGPSGLNKTTADWIYLLTTSGNITGRNITKSGAIIKWNLDGTVVTQNSLPAYTKGANAGVVTMTSTDGYDGVITFSLNANSFTNTCPTFNFHNATSFNVQGSNFFSGNVPNWIMPKVTACYFNANLFSGIVPNHNFPLITTYYPSANAGITGFAGNLVVTNNMSTEVSNIMMIPTSGVNARLKAYNDMFAVTPPIKNLTLNLSGATMGIPTGAGSNIDLLGILAKFTAAGFTATIIVRTV